MSTNIDAKTTVYDDIITVTAHHPPTALTALRQLLIKPTTTRGWLYRVNEHFMRELLAETPDTMRLDLITDARTHRDASHITNLWPNVRFRTWSSNRTMHDKTFFNAGVQTVILTTNNGAVGSWTLSKNRCTSIVSRDFCEDLYREWTQTWSRCRPVLPAKRK